MIHFLFIFIYLDKILNNEPQIDATMVMRILKNLTRCKIVDVLQVYWKLVQHGESCTVAVGHNNVHLKTKPTPICNAVDVHGWPELKVLSKGYTYYCEYESFKKTVYYVPDIECTSLFEFPQ